jgi:hypothetical protein
LMLPGLFEVISDKFKQYPDEYTSIYNVKTSIQKKEEGLIIEGFGAAPQKNEGAPVAYVDLTQGYKTSFEHLTFARGTRVTREDYDDDLYKVFKNKLGTYLARCIKQRREILAADILNNGFANTGADGVVLFATNHPYKSGGTYSNTLAAQADLSAQSLKDLITVMEKTTDAGGSPIQLIAKKLIVSSDNRWAAKVILKSGDDPTTANRSINPLAGEGITSVVNHYLTDTDAWFLQADQHGMLFFNRQSPKIEADDDFDSGDAKLKITMRASAGYDDPRGICGSAGV